MELKLAQPESDQGAVGAQPGGVMPSQDVLDHQSQVAAGTAAEVPEALKPYDWKTEEPQGGVTMTGEGSIGKEGAQKDTEATQSGTPIIQRPLIGVESAFPEIDTRFDSDHPLTSTPEGNVYSATSKPVDHGTSSTPRTDPSMDGLLVDDKPLPSEGIKSEADSSGPESAQKMPETYLKPSKHEPGINRVGLSESEIANLKVDDRVPYTTLKGETKEYIVRRLTSGDEHPGLTLEDPDTKTVFAISGNPSGRMRRRRSPEPPAEQPPAEQPPAEQPPAEQPPAEQPPAEPPVEVDPPGGGVEPPDNGGDGGNGGGETPGTPEGRPETPEGTTLDATREALAPISTELEAAIQRLAKAKDRRESIISKVHKKIDGRNDQAELDAASQNLKDVFAKYVTAVASECVDQTGTARRKLAELAPTVLKDPGNPSLGFADGIDPNLIDEYTRAKESMNDVEKGNALMIVQEMAAARYRVDQAQLDIKASKKGGKWIGKFRSWWTKHPGMRAGIGAGLMVIGTVGTATGAAPLAIGAFAARRAIGATGTYMGIEGAGRFVTNKRSERADKKAAEKGLEDLGATPGGAAMRSSAEGQATAGSEFKAGTSELLPDQEKQYVEQFIQENFKDIFSSPEGLRALLRGAEVDPAAVTNKLLDRKLDQLKSDVTWTRRSKYLAAVGAAVFSAYALNQIREAVSSPGGGGAAAQPGPETPPSAGAPSDLDINKAFMSGMENRMGPDQYQSSWKALKAAGKDYSKTIFDSNPVNSKWVETVRSLPPESQLKAARFLGDSMVKEPLSQQTLDQAVSYFGS